MLRIILFLLPLGLDTLGVSIGLGMMGTQSAAPARRGRHPLWERGNIAPLPSRKAQLIVFPTIPPWLRSAILFALAEAIMPLIGLAIGYASALLISGIMNIVGALLLIAVGGWELLEEISERYKKRRRGLPPAQSQKVEKQSQQKPQGFAWRRQLLLALSVSLDELAVGFSFGAFSTRANVSPLILCAYIGIQGLLMAIIGIAIGRILRERLRWLKEWSELLSGVLLIGLGIWLLVT